MEIHDLAAAEASSLSKSISAAFDKLVNAAAAEGQRQAAQFRAEAQAAAQAAADAAAAERAKLAEAIAEEKRLHAQAAQQLKEQSAALSFADAARKEADAAREKEASQRTAAEAAAAAARSAAASAEAAAAAAAERAADAERAAKDAEAAHAEQLRATRARLAKGALQPLDHLRTAFDRLRAAASIDDVLQTMLEAMATEFSRVAVFDVNAHRLEVSRHSGFEGAGDMSKVVVPLTLQSPLTKAVREGRVQGLTSRELTETTRALVGGSPSFVLVLPVPIRGQVKAVLYADDSGQTTGELSSAERRVRFAEILLWHTVPLLTRLALEDEALAEFREYAASLVNDLESVYLADSAKHKGGDLRKRLQVNLQYARRRFTERVQDEGPAAAKLLDEQLAAALDRKGSTPFGRDLAAAASGAIETSRQPQAAADAS